MCLLITFPSVRVILVLKCTKFSGMQLKCCLSDLADLEWKVIFCMANKFQVWDVGRTLSSNGMALLLSHLFRLLNAWDQELMSRRCCVAHNSEAGKPKVMTPAHSLTVRPFSYLPPLVLRTLPLSLERKPLVTKPPLKIWGWRDRTFYGPLFIENLVSSSTVEGTSCVLYGCITCQLKTYSI